jgi:transcription-repair coupling factor (superfamily II helicase)
MSILPVYGAPEGVDAILLARRAREAYGAVLHIARDEMRLGALADLLSFFAPDIPLLRFPGWDCLPYDRASPGHAVIAERVATLSALLTPPAGPFIVLTSAAAVTQRVPPSSVFANASLTLREGGIIQPEKLSAFLVARGYNRTDTVMEPGEFSWRGGIVDIFPSGEADPVRLDLFGDTIDTIRVFNPETQRSTGKTAEFSLRPLSEVPMDAENISLFRESYRDRFGLAASQDTLYVTVSEGRRCLGLEHFAPLFFSGMATLADYLPGAAICLDHQIDEVFAARLEMIADHYEARRAPPRDGESPYRPLPPDMLYLTRENVDELVGNKQTMQFVPFLRPDTAPGIDAGGRVGPIFAGTSASGANPIDQYAAQVKSWAGQKKRAMIAAYSRGSCARLVTVLREHGLHIKEVADFAAALRMTGPAIAAFALPIERGFVFENFVISGEQDLLGERIARPPKRKKRADQFIADATEIAEGDLVVHQEYGIGRYHGLEKITVGGAPHDCLRLIYDGEQKLFLPVENIELLSRYGSETTGVALDKLGGSSWQSRKAKMKQRIREMAGELIRIAAERRLREAPLIAPPEGAWDEFCARFPFTETEDQARAISDVLEDLASGKPMDRLICGDVGFGKTEVALRAAFAVAMTGAQVAVVVPTTLLARQHFRTFKSRFADLPVNVAQLSRMVTAKDAAEIKRGMVDGTINIVIGTHALLAKNIGFADLGLLIVDEEQHFGVAHKERLKALRTDVHVLTLTATPIPRTLQLALTGVREMSVIATPPVDRMAVRTFIMPFDHVVLREAIQRERFRGGQIFCVAPRVEDLPKLAARLAEIVPEARVIEAHGRLTPTELERVMTEFGDGKYDILLSTNIVESGLDMPAVNTLIIHRADLFGLGQLYQLRGRVGRGKQRGYAYLTWPPGSKLSVAAQKRLEVMQTLDTLGAGFTLASHDLDIRGAGNLLGDEQSGHIREVGIELYQQMLEDAVAELSADKTRGRGGERDWTPNINLGLPVMIPEEYVRDLPVRLGLYRRISNLINDAETDAMAAELVDRFGKLPDEAANLLEVMRIKRLCRAAGVEKLEAGPKGMVLQFRGNVFANPAGLVAWLGTQKGAVKLRPDHKLAKIGDMALAVRVKAARDMLGALAKLVT